MYFCDRRNVMNWKDANTTEIDPDTPYPVVIDMPEHNPGQMGGTMRLGKRTTIFHGDSIISKFIRVWHQNQSKILCFITEKLYGNVGAIDERHRHRYEVNPEFVDKIEKAGLHFVGT